MKQANGAWTLANVLPNEVCLMAAILYVSGVMHQEKGFAVLTVLGDCVLQTQALPRWEHLLKLCISQASI